MPIMDFLLETKPSQWPGQIFAVMLYPDDSSKREEFLTVTKMDYFRNWPDDIPFVPPEQLQHITRILHRAPSSEDIMGPRFFKNVFNSGLLAGEKLYVIAQIEKSGLGGSAEKAEYLINKEPFKTVSGKNIPCCESYTQRAWKRHSSVSHLWAAQRIFHYLYDPNIWPLDSPKEFLQVSEYFRWFGELHTAGNTGIPTLDRTATWRPPEDLPLDEIPLTLPKLSEQGRLWVKEFLELKKIV